MPTLQNKEEMMLVEVPDNARDFKLCSGTLPITYSYLQYCTESSISQLTIPMGKTSILGTYYKGEIDFEVKEEWVEREDESVEFNFWKDYTPEQHPIFCLDTAKESFLSLLQSLTAPDKKYVVLIKK